MHGRSLDCLVDGNEEMQHHRWHGRKHDGYHHGWHGRDWCDDWQWYGNNASFRRSWKTHGSTSGWRDNDGYGRQQVARKRGPRPRQGCKGRVVKEAGNDTVEEDVNMNNTSNLQSTQLALPAPMMPRCALMLPQTQSVAVTMPQQMPPQNTRVDNPSVVVSAMNCPEQIRPSSRMTMPHSAKMLPQTPSVALMSPQHMPMWQCSALQSNSAMMVSQTQSVAAMPPQPALPCPSTPRVTSTSPDMWIQDYGTRSHPVLRSLCRGTFRLSESCRQWVPVDAA